MPTKYKDYYKTLGVQRNASQDEIRKAFRGLARQFHPDITGNDSVAEERFKEVNEAYEVLGDSHQRRRYNRIDASWESEGDEWEFRGTGFSEFFHDFFTPRRNRAAGTDRQKSEGPPPAEPSRSSAEEPRAESASRKSPQAAPTPERGKDIQHDLLITLNQALHGTKKRITVKRPGADAQQTAYEFRVPPGIREGQTIRLSGKGRPGTNGGESGDLLLRVHYERHPDFEVDGADLHCTLKIAPWDAVLGGDVLLPTLDKPVPMKIKSGTQGGRSLRIRNLGLPTGETDGARGDIIAQIQIVIPHVTGAQELRLWKKLKQSSRWSPQ